LPHPATGRCARIPLGEMAKIALIIRVFPQLLESDTNGWGARRFIFSAQAVVLRLG